MDSFARHSSCMLLCIVRTYAISHKKKHMELTSTKIDTKQPTAVATSPVSGVKLSFDVVKKEEEKKEKEKEKEVVVPGKNLSAKARADYDLVLKAVDGNQKAYETLLNRYKNSVFHTIYKMVSNTEEANDLTLEAFGKAFHKLPSYAPHYAFSTWLYRIAINNCIDHLRKKRLHVLSIDDPIEPGGAHDFANNIRSSALNPEEKVIRSQKLNMVRRVIDSMNPKYRTMLELRYYQELSYDEIAKKLEIPLGTVKAQLFRAKEILSGLLSQPGPGAYLETTTLKRKVKTKAKAK